MRTTTRRAANFLSLALSVFGACGVLGGQTSSTSSAKQEAAPRALELSGEYAGTHDPSIAYERGTYYVFATGAAFSPRPAGTPEGARPGEQRPKPVGQFQVRCSPDLHVWKRCGAVFSEAPTWIREMSPLTRDLWAPDISFFDGLWHLYYSFSVFGKNTSGIALATNTTLDPTSPKYKWVDHGLVLQSKVEDSFNAIDPNLILDKKGEAWLAFGSFWSGIKMRHLDRSTGLLSQKDTRLYSLASRAAPAIQAPRNPDLPPDSEAVEAPFLLHHGDYYYLFVSWDLCCRGLKSTYRTMVGRSHSVTGPFLDRDGKPMLEGGGSQLLVGNAKWLGPGGESLLHMPTEDIIVFHAYSATDGRPSLHISTLGWKDGWPSASLEGDGH
jgi:arabinan endo-1,5-alpha-L-arabinosidase